LQIWNYLMLKSDIGYGSLLGTRRWSLIFVISLYDL
jgi:hypothetical protein